MSFENQLQSGQSHWQVKKWEGPDIFCKTISENSCWTTDEISEMSSCHWILAKFENELGFHKICTSLACREQKIKIEKYFVCHDLRKSAWNDIQFLFIIIAGE